VWSEAEDQILGGDLAVALAYVTPAGSAVVTPVSPVGLRDRDAQTVAFTTSLGFGRKLDRIKENPRVALAYHAREHGFAREPRFVLVQGLASYDPKPDREVLEQIVRPASTRFMGAPRTGFFWSRWLSAYYEDRILVTVEVRRVVSWPDLGCSGEPTVFGEPQPAQEPDAQTPPKNGTGPRVDVQTAARRIEKLPHVVLGYLAADGFPLITPVRLHGTTASGLSLQGSLPAGGRRAGLLAHRFEQKLIGLEARQFTGWLENDVYAPHTESGFRAPANKTLLLLANGMLARRGLKQARALGRA
jgi:hypothetical protein